MLGQPVLLEQVPRHLPGSTGTSILRSAVVFFLIVLPAIDKIALLWMGGNVFFLLLLNVSELALELGEPRFLVL